MLELSFFSQYFFTDWLLIFLSLCGIFLSLKLKTYSHLRVIILYLVSIAAIQSLSIYYDAKGFTVGINAKKASILLNMYMLVECTVIYYYILMNLKRHGAKISVSFFYFSFIGLSITIWKFYRGSFYLYNPHHIAIEHVTILFCCLIYFYEFLISSQEKSNLNQPSFWVVTGIVFANSVCIPLYLLLHYFSTRLPQYIHAIDSVIFILYCIQLIFILKAFLCQSEIQV